MARRRSRRNRRSRSFFPLLIRVVLLVVIVMVTYRYVFDRSTPIVEGPVNGSPDQVTISRPVPSNDAQVLAASAQASVDSANAQAQAGSQWSIFSPSTWWSTDPKPEMQLTTKNLPQTTIQTANQSVTSDLATTQPATNQGDDFSPATGARTGFLNVSDRSQVDQKRNLVFKNPANNRVVQPKVNDAPNDGKSASQIFAAMQDAYRQTRTYSDQGFVRFTYRHNGELKHEQQPFATRWDTSNRRYSGRVCSTGIQCDGKLLSCSIYDVDTENFKNQQLIIPVEPNSGPPIAQLLNDPFALGFLSGSEDLTLIPPRIETGMYLMPPALALLSGQVSSPWLTNSAALKRLPDETLKPTGTQCYVLQTAPSSSVRDAATVWIHKRTNLIKQIKYPQSIVISRVLTNPQFADFELLASFPDQRVDQPLPADQFSVKLNKNASPVRKFIRLPDALPAESIGRSASSARFWDRNGQPIQLKDVNSKITTVAWIGDDRNVGLVDQLAQFKKASPPELGFYAVYTGMLAESPANNGAPKPIRALRDKERLGIPLLFDDGSVLTDLQVKPLPALLVLDETGKVQFAQSMADPAWNVNLQSALQRVARGDAIAEEMLDQYVKHYKDYGDEIEKFNARNFFASATPPTVSDLPRRQLDSSVKLMPPNKKWQQNNFSRPGNITVLPQQMRRQFGGAHYATFDGAQTVKFLDDRGRIVDQKSLAIENNPAIRVLRYHQSGPGWFAGFERMGQQVHIFDAQMKLAGSFPDAEQKHAGILDCQPVPGAAGQFLISFNGNSGVYLFDVNTGEPKKVSDQIASVIAISVGNRNRTVAVVDGQAFDLQHGDLVSNVEHIHQLIPAAGNGGDFGATVRLGPTQWAAIGLSDQLKQTWKVDLKSQLTQTPVEPIAVAQNSAGETFWAVVDDQSTVCLISGRGTWLGDWKSGSPIRGLAVSTSGKEIDLIVSNEDGVVAWALNYQAR